MSRILNGLFSKGLTLARGFSTRPQIYPQSDYIHPEKRRTFPIVYYTWDELPNSLGQEKAQEFQPEIVASPEEKPYSRKSYLRHLFLNKGNNFLNDVHRWSEFRRKLVYGVY
ncbi:hypothetical protein KR032_003599 [Drosophila birchii]|nr:hypothetical protein KR032_003599 [Drosophila birchii]